MIKSNWNYPTTVWIGDGRIKELSLACKNLGINKPLFVTDMDLAKTNMVIIPISINLKPPLFSHLQFHHYIYTCIHL